MRAVGRELVVDTNALRSERLREFLAQSRANVAVLIDYAAMEAYKGDALVGIYESMAILRQFPSQVWVLKDTATICGLRGRAAGLRRRMVHGQQTAGFAKFCSDVDRAKNGDRARQKAIANFGIAAREQMDEFRGIASDLVANVAELSKVYSDEELKILRSGSAMTPPMMLKFAAGVRHTAGVFYETHPSRPKWPSIDEFANTFLFRAALCSHLMALRWTSVGGAVQKRPDRVRNDMVDMVFAAYGTFFDGLMTSDEALREMHADAKLILRAIAPPS